MLQHGGGFSRFGHHCGGAWIRNYRGRIPAIARLMAGFSDLVCRVPGHPADRRQQDRRVTAEPCDETTAAPHTNPSARVGGSEA